MGAVQERIVKVGHQECVWMGARGRAWWQWVAEGSRYEFVLLPVITGVVMGRESKQGCPLFLKQSVCVLIRMFPGGSLPTDPGTQEPEREAEGGALLFTAYNPKLVHCHFVNNGNDF